jgi:hypothetical protein
MPRKKTHSKHQKTQRTKQLKQTHLNFLHHRPNSADLLKPEAVSEASKPAQENKEGSAESFSNDNTKLGEEARKHTQTKLKINTTTNIPFGDLVHNSEAGETILFHNINGMKDSNNWNQIITSMREMNIDIFGFAELNKSLERGYSNEWVQTIRKSYYYSRSIYSESNLLFETPYKPGGTMTTVTGKWQSRVTEMGQDDKGLGRWSYVRLRSKKTTLMIMTAYRPVMSQGPNTVWMQQWALLRESGLKNPDPIETFYTDLDALLQEWKKLGFEIILMMDSNEPIGEKPGKLTSILSNAKLTDLVRHRHPEAQEPNTHIRGSKRIDFIFGSAKVLENCSNAGILPFGMGYHSDHRAIFATIQIDKVLMANVSTVDSITARKLQQATPRERETFILKAYEILENQNIFQKMNSLNAETTWSEDNRKTYETCDELITQSMIIAEGHTRRLKVTPWSPKFAIVVAKKSFWKIALSLKINHIRPNSDYLKWAESYNIQDFASLPISVIKQSLRQAQHEVREVEKQADDLRQKHLMDLLSNAELNGTEQQIQKRLRILLRAQKQKQNFQRLKKIFKPNATGGLSYILVPQDFKAEQFPYDPNSVETWEPVHDPDALQQFIQTRNIKHFGQAHNTPFTVPPLNSLTWQANSIEAQAVIKGSIPTGFLSDNPYTKRVLEYIANRENLPEIDTYITPEQLCKGMKKWRETTSTSPSGFHLGLRRIVTYPAEEQETEEARKQLLKIQADIINIPITQGFSPKRWQTVVNAMLEKIPGKPFLHKLRVIHILEADYNLALKEIFGRRLMWNCEKFGKLGDIQDGFRKGRSTVRTLLHNEIINDYNKRLRRNNFVGMTDISGCFDRMVTPMISILNRKNGCPQAAVTMHGTTLEKAQYHLKTKHGTSKSHYSHSEQTPIYGNGQGAGDSPSQWCQQSALLFDLYAESNQGSTMTSRNRKTKVNIPLAAFADDTNLLGNDDENNMSVEDLITQTQEAFTSWNNLLHATGHFMELEKCSCYLSVWDFQEDGYAFTIEPEDLQKKVTVMDLLGKQQEITQLSTATSQKLLGVMKNPIGNQQDEFFRLREKSNKIAANLNGHALSRVEAKLAYEAFYIPAMRYSLAITSMNQIDLETVQRKVTSSLLASLGYNRNMPREVIFCSKKYQGLGLKHLYDLQGADSTCLLLQELNHRPGKTRMMIGMLLEVIQLEAGIQKPILEENRPLQYIEWGWIPSIRDFLLHIDGRIVNASQGIRTYRENDQLIMDIESLTTMTRKEQILINRCRLALQVECISDITDMDGKMINKAWLSLRATKPSYSIKSWPLQGDPGKEAWSIWQRFLSTSLTRQQWELRQPLGRWIARNESRVYRSNLAQHEGTLWRRVQTKWNVHKQISHGRRGYVFSSQFTMSEAEPEDLIPIDVIKMTDREIRTGQPQVIQQKNDRGTGKITLLGKLQEKQSEILFHDISLLMEENQINEALRNTAIIDVASDGSHDQESGVMSYGWVAAVNETVIAEGKGPAEGHQELAQSFRAEAYGLASVTGFLKLMTEHFNTATNKHKWFIHLDNKSLIKRMESYQNEVVTSKWALLPDIDITNLAHKTLTGINAQFHHVKGHQNRKSDHKLDFPAQLNIKADGLAELQRKLMKRPITGISIPHCHLVIAEKFVNKDIQRQLLESASKVPIQHYYKEKLGWTSSVFSDIAWELQSKVLCGYDINDQRRLLKFVHGWLPTNKRLHRENKSPHQRCPMCYYIVEDDLHLLLCRHPEQVKKVQEMFNRMQKELQCDSQVKQILIDIVQTATKNKSWSPTLIRNTTSDIQKGANAQQRIGWEQVIFGRMARAFVQTLAPVPTSTDSSLLASISQGKKCLRIIWDTILELWRQRNEFIYGITQETKKAALVRAIEMKVEKCYDWKPFMPFDDQRRIYQKSKEELMSEELPKIQTWVRMAERIIRTNKKEAQRNHGQRKRFEQYFKWNPPDQSRRSTASEDKQHRKNDLKPD